MSLRTATVSRSYPVRLYHQTGRFVISFRTFDFPEKHQDSPLAIYSATADTDTPGTRHTIYAGPGGRRWVFGVCRPEGRGLARLAVFGLLKKDLAQSSG